jgi:hypothetical protein
MSHGVRSQEQRDGRATAMFLDMFFEYKKLRPQFSTYLTKYVHN